MKSVFFSFIRTTYGVAFSVIIAILLFFANVPYLCKKDFLLPNGAIFCIIIALILAGAFFYSRAKDKKIWQNAGATVNVDKIVNISTVILFLGQCYVFYNAFFISGWDTGLVRNFVDVISNDLDRSGVNYYFSQYPNNLFISYLYFFLNKIHSCFGIFSKQYSYMCIVVLNCVINSFSCWLSYKTAKIFLSPLFSLVAYILCIFSVGISGWSVVCYSDSLALFIPILSVYLYCKQYKIVRMKTVGFILSGVVSAVGYFIKPQCLFVLIAIVIIEILKLIGKHSFKALIRPVAICLVAITVFGTVNSGFKLLNKKYNIQIDKERSFGYSHFLMMGANEETNGVYSANDVAFSDSFSTSEDRSKANIDVFKNRVAEMKGDIITHLQKKMLITFNDGTFAWGNEGNFFVTVPENINSVMAPFLKSIYHLGDYFIYFATFQQFVWLFILFCAFLTVLSKKTEYEQHKLSLFWIVLLGLVLYQMLFEVRARYIYIFVPLLCTLAPIGIKNTGVLMHNFVSRIKNKLQGDNKK